MRSEGMVPQPILSAIIHSQTHSVIPSRVIVGIFCFRLGHESDQFFFCALTHSAPLLKNGWAIQILKLRRKGAIVKNDYWLKSPQFLIRQESKHIEQMSLHTISKC